MSAKRVLPADVYDTLELAALIHGGIGAGRDYSDATGCPVCVHGLAYEAGDWEGYGHHIAAALYTAGVLRGNNDNAVKTVNARRGRPEEARVPFAEWCRELGVERGA